MTALPDWMQPAPTVCLIPDNVMVGLVADALSTTERSDGSFILVFDDSIVTLRPRKRGVNRWEYSEVAA